MTGFTHTVGAGLARATRRLLASLIIGFALGGLTRASGQDDLAGYYGFGPLEILKLQRGVTLPVIVDINNDDLNDMVVANNGKARIELLLQKRDFAPDAHMALEPEDPEDINDLFGKEKNWRFKRISYPLDVAVISLVVADLNQDGRPDLAYYAKDGLYIALQKAPPSPPQTDSNDYLAEPTWLPATRFDITHGLANRRGLAAGDLNHDGRTDLALLVDGGIEVILQNDRGQLDLPVTHHSDAENLRRIYIADINGDQLDDLVLLTSSQQYPPRVRFQAPSGQLGPEIRYRLAAPYVFELATLGNAATSCFVTVSRESGRVLVSALARQTEQEDYPVYVYPLPAADKAGDRDIVAADLNGDSSLEVIASDPDRAEFLLFHANRETGLAGPDQFPGFKDMQKLCAADLQGDGKMAIVALSFREKLIGISRWQNGRLSFPETVEIVGEPQAIEVADINGDGQHDLIYIGKDKNDGDEKFVLRTILSLGRPDAHPGLEHPLKEVDERPRDLRVGDLDHDGNADVLVLRDFGPMLLLRQTQPDQFTQESDPRHHTGLVTGILPSALSLVPLGEKGATAALVAQKNFARSLIFSESKGWQVIDQYQADNPSSNLVAAAAGLLDDPDDIRIITYDKTRGKVAILARQDDGAYRTAQQIDVGPIAAKKIHLGHFGGVAPTSILIAGAEKLILVPVRNQTRVIREIASFESDVNATQFGALAVGDINNDGGPDILLCDQGRHEVEILTFNDQAKLVSATRFKIFEAPRGLDESLGREGGGGEPRRITLGDVTGDGLTDLILLVHDRIIIYPQDNPADGPS